MRKKIFEVLFRTITMLSVATLYFAAPFTAYAAKVTTIQSMKADLAALEQKKRDIANERAMTEAEKRQKENNMYSATVEKQNNLKKVEAAEIAIEQSNKDIIRTTEETNDILRALQISNGESAYLEYLAGAKTTSDLIYRSAVAEQMAKYQEEQIDKLNNLILENQKLKEDLANRNKELEDSISRLNSAISSLGSKLAEVASISVSIDDEIKMQRETIQHYQAICGSETQNINTCGNSVGYAAGWRKPLTRGRITSFFGWRTHPISGRREFHEGIDIGGNSTGTPIYAPAAGKVAYKGILGTGGNTIILLHNVRGKNYSTLYMHMNSYGNVSVGSMVTSDTIIGYVGSTGNSTGPHLHYAVSEGHWSGSWNKFLGGLVEPPGFPTSLGIWWYSR